MSVFLHLITLTFKFSAVRDKLHPKQQKLKDLPYMWRMYYKQISNFNIYNMYVHLITRHKPQIQDGDGGGVICLVWL